MDAGSLVPALRFRFHFVAAATLFECPMDEIHLLRPYRLHDSELANQVVLAPMTRSGAGIDRVPTMVNAEYYVQRSAAGLLVTEATTISP